MTSNPPKKVAYTSFIVAAVFGALIFVPELIGIDGFEGGFAVSFISLVIAIIAFVVGVMYIGQASRLDRLLRGEGVLAHWVYSTQFWQSYAGKEYITEKTEKRGLFFVVTGFALFFGVLFWVIDSEAGFFVFLVMLGLIGLCLFAWQFSAWNNYRQNMGSGVKEAYITYDGVFMNGKYVTWRVWLTRLDEVTLQEDGALTLLVFRYTSYGGRTGPQTYYTRVPVPAGEEPTASYIVEQFGMQN